MKNLKNLLAVAVVAVAATSQVQAHTFPGSGTPNGGTINGNRALNFTPNGAFGTVGNGDGQTTYSVPNASIQTVVHVNPYLYVTGVLGGEWDVDGWGEGSKATAPGEQYLDVYHSDPVKVSADDWDDPIANAGTAFGHEIHMRFSATSKNAAGASINLFNVNNVAVQAMNLLNNNVWKPDGPAASATQGHARFDFTFTLKPDEETYSGTYYMDPILIFTNQ